MTRRAIGAVVTLMVVLVASCHRDVDRLPAESAERNGIVVALQAFRHDIGRYPSSQEGLEALLRDPGVPGWTGPYYPESGSSTLSRYCYAAAGVGFELLEAGSGSSEGAIGGGAEGAER